jgi:hypothetical protein
LRAAPNQRQQFRVFKDCESLFIHNLRKIGEDLSPGSSADCSSKTFKLMGDFDSNTQAGFSHSHQERG